MQVKFRGRLYRFRFVRKAHKKAVCFISYRDARGKWKPLWPSRFGPEQITAMDALAHAATWQFRDAVWEAFYRGKEQGKKA